MATIDNKGKRIQATLRECLARFKRLRRREVCVTGDSDLGGYGISRLAAGSNTEQALVKNVKAGFLDVVLDGDNVFFSTSQTPRAGGTLSTIADIRGANLMGDAMRGQGAKHFTKSSSQGPARKRDPPSKGSSRSPADLNGLLAPDFAIALGSLSVILGAHGAEVSF